MADDTIASVIPLHQVPLKKRERKAAGRTKTDRPRKRKAKAAASEEAEYPSSASLLPSEFLIPPEFLPANDVAAEPPVTPPAATSHPNEAVIALARTACAGSVIDRRACARHRRHHDQRLVCPIVGVKRRRGMAFPCRWRRRRPRRPRDAVLCRRPMAERAARNRIGRLDRLGDDVRICGDGGHRLRLHQYQRRDHCARLARNAGDCERARPRSTTPWPRATASAKAASGNSAGNAKPPSSNGVRFSTPPRPPSDRPRTPRATLRSGLLRGSPAAAAADAGRLRHAPAGPAGVAAANRRNPAPDRTPFGAEIFIADRTCTCTRKKRTRFWRVRFLTFLGRYSC